jgi:hypothetical protein
MISEWWWIVKHLVGSGHGLILRYYPSISLEGLRKPRKKPPSGQLVAGAKIWTRGLPNTKQQCQPLNHNIWQISERVGGYAKHKAALSWQGDDRMSGMNCFQHDTSEK